MWFRYCKRFIKSIVYLEFKLILELIMFIELCKISKLVMHLNPCSMNLGHDNYHHHHHSLFLPCDLSFALSISLPFSFPLLISLSPSLLVTQLSGGVGVSIFFFKGGERAHRLVYFVLQFSLCSIFIFLINVF